MAVAAHADRRHGHQPDPARRRRHRVRRRVLRSPTGSIPISPPTRSAISTRRRGRSCARCRATIRSSPMPSGNSRVVLGESGRARRACRTRQEPSGDRVCDARARTRSPSCIEFPGLLRNVRVLEEAAAGRGLFTIVPERDGIVRRVPMIMQAQGVTMPVAQLRDAAGCERLRHHPDQDRQGRHPEHRRQGLADSDRRATASSGCIMRTTIPRSMSRPSTCWTGTRSAGQDRRQAGADRHLGRRAERHQDHAGFAGRCRAWRFTPRCWKAR